jgi:DNA-binding NarL/FixJ family response regulator
MTVLGHAHVSCNAERIEEPPIRLSIVDAHPLLAGSMDHLLAHRSDIEIVGQTRSLNGVMGLLDELARLVDIVLIHVVRVDATVARLVERVSDQQAAGRKPYVVVVSGGEGDDEVLACVQAGARGYLDSTASFAELLLAIKLVAQGGAGFSAAVAARLADVVRLPGPSARHALQDLTEREREVLDLVARGYDNRGIARDLFLSEKTVRNHLSRVFQKLQVRDRLQAAIVARDAWAETTTRTSD